MRRIGTWIGIGLIATGLTACDPPPETAGDPCVQGDPGKRGLGGTLVRQQTGTPSFELLDIGGDVRRNGRLSSILVGDYAFDARIDRSSGGFKAARDSTAVPVEMFKDVAEKVTVYDLTYKPQGGPVFAGKAVLGPPTPPSQMAASGSATFKGPVQIEATNLDPEAEVATVQLTGTAELNIQYGSKTATLMVAGLSGADTPPFTQIIWTGLQVCGARLVSSGKGGFRIKGVGDVPVNFAGPSATSPVGAAILDSRFFGTSEAGLPTSLGGAVLIQGDSGLISAVFVANPES